MPVEPSPSTASAAASDHPGATSPPERPSPPLTPREQLVALAARWPWAPGRTALAAAVALLALAGGWWLLQPPPPPVEASLPLASQPAPSGPGAPLGSASTGPVASQPAELVVHAAGAVARPGLYRLPSGSRVDDLVDAAGGLAPEADANRLNLAAPLVDGSRVYVPRVGEPEPAAITPGPPGGAGGEAAGGSPSATTAPGPPVNLNTATIEQLDTLPGVGPTTAQAILDYRAENGPFRTVDDLLDVRGIGDAKLAELRDRVTV